MIVCLLGILKAGAVRSVPLDPSYPDERLGLVLEDAEVSVLLTQQHLKGRLRGQSAPVLCTDETDLFSQESTANPPNATYPDNLAYVIFTSGSTADPKACRICHGQVPLTD